MKNKNKICVPVAQSPVSQNFHCWDAGDLGRWGTLISFVVFLFVILTITGCQTTKRAANSIPFEHTDSFEAQWIRNGEPIEFESELWYPIDGVESFLDSEMLLMGEHNGVQFFVDKVDIRPYGRLYTKFDNNKFRFFEKRVHQ